MSKYDFFDYDTNEMHHYTLVEQMIIASSTGDLEEMKNLVEAHSELVNCKGNITGTTLPLDTPIVYVADWMICMYGDGHNDVSINTECAKYLMSMGASLDAITTNIVGTKKSVKELPSLKNHPVLAFLESLEHKYCEDNFTKPCIEEDQI